MQAEFALQCINLTRCFGTPKNPSIAVQDLNFSILMGESVAFLGPNGAGKSTTIKLLCGILTPTSGEAKLLSQKTGTRNALNNLGLVFGTRTQLWMNLTVFDSLMMTCEIYNVPRKEQKERIQAGAHLFQVEDLLHKLVRSLSLGQRMRCEIVAAILHRPKILLLDEPTIGLDVVSKFLMRDLLSKWKQEYNTTLLLTSHDMSDVEKLCSRVLLINKGKLEFDGSLASLKGQLGSKRRISVWLADSTQHLFECEQKDVESKIQQILNEHTGKLQDLRVEDIPLEEVMHSRYTS